MDAAKLLEGITLLIDLAQRGEIDPWDVQVIEVIDRYLSELIETQEMTQGACEAELSQSGQAFLSASMLVLFKANTLIELASPEADVASEEIASEAEDGAGARMRLPLERQLHRRPAALPPQKRRVALQELVEQLQLMAAQLQQQESAPSTKTTRNRHRHSQSRAQAARAIAQLAHQENLTEVAAQLEQFLKQQSHLNLAPEQDWLYLDQLVELWTQSGAASTQHASAVDATSLREESIPPQTASEFSDDLPTQHNNRVSVFWALLLLSAQSKVELVQEEFYQEIKIRTLSDLVGNGHPQSQPTTALPNAALS